MQLYISRRAGVNIDKLKSEISMSGKRIPGVRVGLGLRAMLDMAGEIELEKFCPIGVPDVVYQLPVLKGTLTILWPDETLDSFDFVLP
jgi:hypothetical protein